MKQLAHLPPPALPTPFSWEDWKKNITGKYTVCNDCDDRYTEICRNCDGAGYVKCCECGNDKECEVCEGKCHLNCMECEGEYRYENYVREVASSYTRYLEFKKIAISELEVYSLALKNSFSEKRIQRGAA